MRPCRRVAVVCGVFLLAAFGSASARSTGLSGIFSGLSGKLRAVFALPGEVPEGVPTRPGAYRLLSETRQALTCFVLTPFSAKVRGSIGSYRMGTWPFESKAASNPAYDNPPGFVEVTPENLGTHVSEHFTLGQFVTKGQNDVWPKYLALDPRLVDKLELTIDELNRRGHPVRQLTVMSGFRTPEYNESGGDPGGRSAVSRHMFGDAADVYPDSRGAGWIDDLNRDGRRDIRDARVLAAAAAAVEEKHPELAGGIGIYPGANGHGPFVHIDARGRRARWGG
jgi:uncharacterized protein YcbK (DUF882 family)